jgi:hypothetical protein
MPEKCLPGEVRLGGGGLMIDVDYCKRENACGWGMEGVETKEPAGSQRVAFGEAGELGLAYAYYA